MNKQETASEFRRRRAVELYREGELKKTIARYLGVGPGSVSNWVRLADEGKSLNPASPSGRPRRMSDKQIEKLRALLENGATAHGWSNEIWTLSRVREMIHRHFGIRFSRSQAAVILNKYLGWTSQLPVTRIHDRDEEQIRRWPGTQFKRILRDAVEHNAYIAFADESGFMLKPTRRRTYAPRGEPPILRTADPHGRISTACALTVSPRKQRANVYFQMLGDDENYTGHSIANFLCLLCDRLNAPVIIVWDCIPIHLAKPVRAVLRAKGNVYARMLPKYAPELNPADKVWGYVKYARLQNFAPPNLDELRDMLRTELLAIKKRPQLLHSFIRQAGLDIKALHS